MTLCHILPVAEKMGKYIRVGCFYETKCFNKVERETGLKYDKLEKKGRRKEKEVGEGKGYEREGVKRMRKSKKGKKLPQVYYVNLSNLNNSFSIYWYFSQYPRVPLQFYSCYKSNVISVYTYLSKWLYIICKTPRASILIDANLSNMQNVLSFLNRYRIICWWFCLVSLF